jgi:phage-related protein
MKHRKLFFYKNYFTDFLNQQNKKAPEKILQILLLVEELEHIPAIFFKHIEGTNGLFEIRIRQSSNAFRVFCFFDEGNLIVIGHGFSKKIQKTPQQEIKKALKHKNDYFNEKESDLT